LGLGGARSKFENLRRKFGLDAWWCEGKKKGGKKKEALRVDRGRKRVGQKIRFGGHQRKGTWGGGLAGDGPGPKRSSHVSAQENSTA